MIEARPYQTKALDKIYSDLQIMQDVLLSGIMGSGKTFMSVRLIQRLKNENPGMNFLILAHKRELISQFKNAFQQFTDIHFRHIGVCCAGLQNKRLDRQITIASIQTFSNMKEQYTTGAGLIIIDECHRIDVTGNTQYKQVIEYLRLQRPNSRILGITATPFRLGLGYCYGNKIKKGAQNLFPVCNHKITYEELRQEGHLVPLKGVVAAHESLEKDLAGVSVNGDYVIDQLGEIVTREIHLNTCIEAIDSYCQGYDCICIVCVNIDHAEKLHSMLHDSTIVHSQLNDLDRQSNMMVWESGQKRIMVSVEILLEGYDLPRLQAIVFCRPTLSAALYLQAVGRVLRTYEGKDHGFLLDLTDNTSRFGTDLDNVKITIPKSVEKTIEKERGMLKICPNCESEVHIALRECSECGFEWPEKECIVAEALPKMKNVEFSAIVPADPVIYAVIDWNIEVHTSKKSGKELGKITYIYQETAYKPGQVFLWLCFPDNYSGFAVQKARKTWETISNDPFPMSVDEFMESNFKNPTNILVDINGRYPEIQEVVAEDAEIEFAMSYDDEIPF